VMEKCWPGNLERLLKLPRRDLLLPSHQQEEELEPRLVGEGGEGFHVLGAGPCEPAESTESRCPGLAVLRSRGNTVGPLR
jgi:hypothetical protein